MALRNQETLTQWHSITFQKTSIPSNNTAINLNLTADSAMSITHHNNDKLKNKPCNNILWFRQLFVTLLHVETCPRGKDCKRPHVVNSLYIHLHIRKWQPSCIIIQATANVQIKYFHNYTSFWLKHPLIFLLNSPCRQTVSSTHTHTHAHLSVQTYTFWTNSLSCGKSSDDVEYKMKEMPVCLASMAMPPELKQWHIDIKK